MKRFEDIVKIIRSQYSWEHTFREVKIWSVILATLMFSDLNMKLIDFLINTLQTMIGYELIKIVTLLIVIPLSLLVDEKLGDNKLEEKWLNRINDNK